MKTFIALTLLAFAIPAGASIVNIQGLSGWTAHTINPNSMEAAFSNDSDAVINYREEGKIARATVYVHQLPEPAEKLGDDLAKWHKVMFPNPATVKLTVLNEAVFKVRGQWRYAIHYQVETGTQLNTMVMATVTGGKLYVFTVEQQRALFQEMLPHVKRLFKTVTIGDISH